MGLDWGSGWKSASAMTHLPAQEDRAPREEPHVTEGLAQRLEDRPDGSCWAGTCQILLGSLPGAHLLGVELRHHEWLPCAVFPPGSSATSRSPQGDMRHSCKALA